MIILLYLVGLIIAFFVGIWMIGMCFNLLVGDAPQQRAQYDLWLANYQAQQTAERLAALQQPTLPGFDPRTDRDRARIEAERAAYDSLNWPGW
jgi:hypothetical protein